MKSKNISPFLFILLTGIFTLFTNSCKEDLPPVVTTFNVNFVTSNSAECAGTINDDGGSLITERGFCLSRFDHPTIEDDTVLLGTGAGSFTYVFKGLLPRSKYYFSAFAKNSIGLSYGATKSFTTVDGKLPIVITRLITDITQTTAVSGGEITFDDGLPITQKGVCWGLISPPKITDSTTNEGSGNENFVSTLTNLTPNTKYYCRAYATNLMGTAYGLVKSFVSLGPPIVTTNSYSNVTQNSANVSCGVTSKSSLSIFERGACWSIGTIPTTLDNKVFSGSGTGNYTCALTNLLPGTTYNIRAFASNSEGTAYGKTLTITTMDKLPPVVTTSIILDIKTTSASCGGNVTSDKGSAVTARGVCWSTNPAPTISDNKSSDGNGTGSFTSNITGLSPNTTYYTRAYATNSAGTAYGATFSFYSFQGLNGTVKDIDLNEYQTVFIGDQTWMAENLKTTKLNDGTPILKITNDIDWKDLSSAAYCFYNDDSANKNIYGCLYKWETVNSGKLCPIGWHVASDAEWTNLTTYLGSTTGSKLKETGTSHWKAPNTGANNSSSFTALPGGYRTTSCLYRFEVAIWWSSTLSGSYAYYRSCSYNSTGISRGTTNKNNGYSVRCIKD